MKRHHWWHRENRVVSSSTPVGGGWKVLTVVTCPTCWRQWTEHEFLSTSDLDQATYGRLT